MLEKYRRFQIKPGDMLHGQWVGRWYSGLTNEKPWNSSWSRLDISSWSGGVSSGGMRVKKRSKFSASRPHCRGEERDGGMHWVWWRVRGRKQGQQQTTKREKREIQLKYGINQSNHSQPKLWNSIGLNESSGHSGSSLVTTLTSLSFTFVRVVTNGRRWLCCGNEELNHI